MHPLILIGRLLGTFLLVSLPLALAAASAAGPQGIAPALALAMVLLGGLHFFSEKILLGFLKTHTQMPASLLKSFELATSDFEFRLPSLALLPASSLQAVALRSAFGPGTLVLTQGLVASLDENELRAVMRLGVWRTREAGTPLRCLCAALAFCLLSRAPTPWTRMLLQDGIFSGPEKESRLTPAKGLLFLALLPGLKTLVRFSRGLPLDHYFSGKASHRWDQFLQPALEKMDRPSASCAGLDHPSIQFLGLSHTRAKSSLIPLFY